MMPFARILIQSVSTCADSNRFAVTFKMDMFSDGLTPATFSVIVDDHFWYSQNLGKWVSLFLESTSEVRTSKKSDPICGYEPHRGHPDCSKENLHFCKCNHLDMHHAESPGGKRGACTVGYCNCNGFEVKS